MEKKPRHFEKYEDFINKRKNEKKGKLNEENIIKNNNFFYRGNKLSIKNKTEPSFNVNLKNIEEKKEDDSGCLSSLRNQINSKGKNNLNNQNLETNYKTFYTNDSPTMKESPKINNTFNNFNKSDKSKIYNSKIEDLINDYKTRNNLIKNKDKVNILSKNNNKVKNRAFSATNLIKNNKKIKQPFDKKIEKKIYDGTIKNYQLNNSLNNLMSINNNFNKNKINKNYKKFNSFNKSNKQFSFDSPILNKELDHILSSYDFKNINNDYNDININDKSIKIHFRNLLYLVKELQAKNELLKKEIRNKNNLISTLEKQIINKNGINKKNINNSMLKEYNDDIILDNNKLKSEILNLEKKLENQKIYYEDLVNDYKIKLNEEKNKNNLMDNNFKNIENKYKYSNNKIIDMKDELKDVAFKKAKLEDINEKYEVINIEQQKKIEDLENGLKVVLTLVKNLFKKENNTLYPMRTNLYYDISNLGKKLLKYNDA